MNCCKALPEVSVRFFCHSEWIMVRAFAHWSQSCFKFMSLGGFTRVSSRLLIARVSYLSHELSWKILVFSLSYPRTRHENPLEIYLYGVPSPTEKFGGLTLPSGRSDPLRGGIINTFWNHTICISIDCLFFPTVGNSQRKYHWSILENVNLLFRQSYIQGSHLTPRPFSL